METAFWLVVWSVTPCIITAFSEKNKSNKKANGLSVTETRMVKVFGVERKIDIPPEDFPTEAELSEQLESEELVPHCEHGWYESVYDRAKLHYRYFVPSQKPPKAVLVYQHGISTHGGKAFQLKSNGRKLNMSLMSEICLKENIALYAPDMYGHGYSEGLRFFIPDTWENNLKDLLTFMDLIDSQYQDVPIFLMGESYGGTLAIHAARQYQDHPETAPKNFRGILLTGPAIIGDLPPYPVFFVLRHILAPLFPKWIPFFMPNPISPERIWRDPEVLALRTDKRFVEMGVDGSGKPFRLGTALNLVVSMEEARTKAIPGFNLPYCIAHGAKDAGVPIAGSEYMINTANTPGDDRDYLRIEDAYHDLLSDPVAEETMDFFIKFMNKHLSK